MAEWTHQERQTAHNQLCDPLRFNNDGSICYTDAIELACQRNRALAESKTAKGCLSCEDVAGAFKHLDAAIAACTGDSK
jgi:hypothetical protein